MRTTAQGFGANETLNNKYALTERDKATGLDHTWFRKYENRAGRWTSPDPYNGSMSLGNPQSFNRYSYVENQPTNFVDPSGLLLAIPSCHTTCVEYGGQRHCETKCDWTFYNIGGSGPGPIGPTHPPFEPGGIGGDDPDPNEVERLIKSCLLNISIIPKKIFDAIKNNSKIARLFLAFAHAATESSFNPNAIGFQGEIGLFQLKPETANSLGLGTFTDEQLKDPSTNTMLGTTHLFNLILNFDGDVRTALGAYKQGETGVRKNGLTKASKEYADGILGCEEKILG